jgi:hypothetical protein
LFAQLDGLCAPPRAQLVEGPAAVGFDRILADEETSGDLPIAKALSDEAEYFKLAGCDAEGVKLGLVEREGDCRIGGDQDFAQDDFSRGFVSLMPSQMPKAAKMMATRAP